MVQPNASLERCSSLKVIITHALSIGKRASVKLSSAKLVEEEAEKDRPCEQLHVQAVLDQSIWALVDHPLVHCTNRVANHDVFRLLVSI